MGRNLRITAFVTCITVCFTVPAGLAHHSFAAQFDSTKQVTLKGRITKVEWTNPHIYLYMDVQGENGRASNWAVEAGAPNVLYRQGWRPDSAEAQRRPQSSPRLCGELIPRSAIAEVRLKRLFWALLWHRRQYV
jgi:hypothetical protein